MSNRLGRQSSYRFFYLVFLLLITFPANAGGIEALADLPALLFALGLTLLMHLFLIGSAVSRFSRKRAVSIPLNFSAFGVMVFSFLSTDIFGDEDAAFKWSIYSRGMILAAMILIILNYTIRKDELNK